MHNTLFFFIIAIIVFGYILEQFLVWLNASHLTEILPVELQGIFDPAEYKRSQAYKKENERFSMITSTFSFLVLITMLWLGGFAWVDQVARGYSQNPILLALIFFGILMFASDLLNTPFSIYDTFVIEEKYGFNKTSLKTYILDKIKGWILGAVMGGGMLALIIWFWKATGSYFWLWAWAATTGFSLFMMMFYSNLIVPLFNKQSPLPDGDLRNAIESFSHKAGFKLKNIYLIDGSKRSSKANAYFTGIGAKKRIVLYDTLVNDLSVEEIVAVLAHEIGHYKKKHTLTGLIISTLETGLTLYIFSLLVNKPELSAALGTNQHSFHLAILAFGVLYSPVSLVLGLAMNVVSRSNEYAADGFAASLGQADNLISALRKLTRKNLSNLTPHPAYVFFHYSHPTLFQRIRSLKKE
jgi:STE24 endopeptidase